MADVCFHLVRPGSLVDEPVVLGPVGGAIDLYVYSSRGQSSTRNVDFLEFANNFSLEFYAYCAAIAVIVAIVMAVNSLHPSNAVIASLRTFFAKTYSCIWSMCETVLNQENFQPSRNFERSLWFFTCVTIFVVVVGYMANVVSTDLVAEVKPPTLDRLEDFFTDTFASLRPVTLTNLFYYEYMKTTRTGLLKDLHARMQAISDCTKNASSNAYIEIEKCSFVDVDLTNSNLFGDMMHLIQTSLTSRTHALLFEKLVYDNMIERLLCATQPELATQIHISASSLAEDIATIFYNRRLDKDLQKAMSFFAQSFILEFSVFSKAAENFVFELGHSMRVCEKNLAYLRCTDKIVDELPLSDIQLQRRALRKTGYTCCAMVCVAVITLCFEVLQVRCAGYVRRWSRKIPSMRWAVVTEKHRHVKHVKTRMVRLVKKIV